MSEVIPEGRAAATAPELGEWLPGLPGGAEGAALADAVRDRLERDPGAVRAALQAQLLGPEPAGALRALRGRGVLSLLLPEVEAMASLAAPEGGPHKDLWEHTLEVLAACPPRPRLRWAALLHDIGKAETRQVTPGGLVSFHGHAERGAELVEGPITERLGLPAGEAVGIGRLVRHHQRAAAYRAGWSDSAVSRLGRALTAPAPGVPAEALDALPEDLVDLARADVTTRLPGRREAALARVAELARRMRVWQQIVAAPAPLPPGLGHALMERFGLRPGPALGRLRRRIDAAVKAGVLPPGRDVTRYLDYVESEGLLEESEP